MIASQATLYPQGPTLVGGTGGGLTGSVASSPPGPDPFLCNNTSVFCNDATLTCNLTTYTP